MTRHPALLVILAACSGTPDGGPDADLPVGEVTVETFPVCCADPIQTPTTPLGGVEIVVNDPDGRVTLAATDDDGRATVEVSDGATVTAVYRLYGNSAQLLTFAGVEPGDLLRFGGDLPPTILAATETMRVDFPPLPGATGFVVASSCSTLFFDAFVGSGEVQHTRVCHPASEDLYLFAYTDDVLTGQGLIADAAFAADGAVELDAWEPVGSLAIDVRGIPADATEVFVGAWSVGNGVPVHDQFAFEAPSGETYAHTFPWPTQTDGAVANAVVVTPDGVRGRFESVAADATAQVFDGFDEVTATVDFSVADERFEYTVDGVGAYDMTVAFVSFHRTDVADIYWKVIAPPPAEGANTLVLPDLPPELDDLELRTATTGAGSIELRELASITSYAQVRVRSPIALEPAFPDSGSFYQPGTSP